MAFALVLRGSCFSAWRGAFWAIVALFALGPPGAKAEDLLGAFNRWSFNLNRDIERTIVWPTARAYQQFAPEGMRRGIDRVYENIIEPATAASYAIEGELRAAGASAARFAVNSTLGVLGIVDVAGQIGLPRRYRAFTEAVCNSGLPLGRYLVLPAVGPTTTGVALAAAVLMIGPTVALAYLSLELALANAALDAIEIGASMQTVVAGGLGAAATVEEERADFVASLPESCQSRIE